MTSLKEYISRFDHNLKFSANAVVEGFISGLHKSPYHGFSVEFSDHKAYSSGDPVDLIDWKIYSKTDRYYIRRYEEETNVRVYFLLDCSMSMSYFSQKVKKIDYARFLTACLIHLSLKQRDATGLTLFSDRIISTIPAKSKTIWLNQCLKHLEHIQCEGNTNIPETIFRISERIKKRSLIVLITDFFDDTDQIVKALNFLKFNKHHCILFHIIDPAEIDFDFRGETDFVDLETNETIRLSPQLIKKEYLNKYNMFLEKHKDIVQRLNFEYCMINTKTPIEDSLKLFLSSRLQKM